MCKVVYIPWVWNPIVQYFKDKFITGYNRIATKKLDNKFLYYTLSNKIDLISSFYRDSWIKHPDINKVLEIKISIPHYMFKNI